MSTAPVFPLEVEELRAQLESVDFCTEGTRAWDWLLIADQTDDLIKTLTGFKMRALAAAQSCAPDPLDERVLKEEWRCLATDTDGGARAELLHAETMASVLPAIADALVEARLGIKQAKVISALLCDPARQCALDDDAFEKVEELTERAIAYAQTHTATQTKARLKTWLMTRDPRTAQLRHELALKDCNVTHTVLDDGIGLLKITGPVTQTLQAYRAIERTALHEASERSTGDEIRIGQRRSRLALDVLLDASLPRVDFGRVAQESTPAATLFAGSRPPDYVPGTPIAWDRRTYASGPPPPRDPTEPPPLDIDDYDYDPLLDPEPPERVMLNDLDLARGSRGRSQRGKLHVGSQSPVLVTITTDLPTLLGIASHPMLLDGTIPITAEHGRRMFDNADFTRLLLEPDTGELLDASPWRYTPNRATRDYAMVADPVCRGPLCDRPSHLCQIDHQEPFNHDDPAAGGLTIRSNLGPLCLNQHQLKTLAGFDIVPDSDGTLVWTTPGGQRIPITTYDHRPTKGERGPTPEEDWAA